MNTASSSQLVANAYSDTLTAIDTDTNQVVETFSLGLPIGVREREAAYGAAAVGQDRAVPVIAK